MTMNFDYKEPLTEVVMRLKKEHKELSQKLLRIERLSKDGDLELVIAELTDMRAPVIRHAVEEEARLMRPIMSEFKGESEESIIIIRYHRDIVDFLEHRLTKLATMPEAGARREVVAFVKGLRKHYEEEEVALFPLALKADSLHEKRG